MLNPFCDLLKVYIFVVFSWTLPIWLIFKIRSNKKYVSKRLADFICIHHNENVIGRIEYDKQSVTELSEDINLTHQSLGCLN